MPFGLSQATQPNLDRRIGNVPAIPCEQYIHSVDGCQSNVGCVAARTSGKKARLKDVVDKRLGGGCQLQHPQASGELEAEARHFALSGGNLIKGDLRGVKLVIGAFQLPPVFSDLLAGGLQQVASRARNNVTRDCALDVNPHGQILATPPANRIKKPRGCAAKGDLDAVPIMSTVDASFS